MASLNITSLPRHIDELRVWMRDQNLDLLAINETRLDSSIPNESVKIINYQIIRNSKPFIVIYCHRPPSYKSLFTA